LNYRATLPAGYSIPVRLASAGRALNPAYRQAGTGPILRTAKIMDSAIHCRFNLFAKLIFAPPSERRSAGRA